MSDTKLQCLVLFGCLESGAKVTQRNPTNPISLLQYSFIVNIPADPWCSMESIHFGVPYMWGCQCLPRISYLAISANNVELDNMISAAQDTFLKSPEVARN